MPGGLALRWTAALTLLALLAACAAGPRGPTDPSAAAIGEYKVGKPYEINGVWYYPKVDWEYRETGIASWYGPGFHGKRTANGEIYNQNDLTAAHPTLPMPVMVRVTNLENGRSIMVRVNDRGPFANNRIIDLSKRSAQLLDMERAGTARVLVEILPAESRQLVAIAQGKTPSDDTDLPQAAPVEAVEAAPLDGATPASPTAPGVPQPQTTTAQTTTTQTASTPPSTSAPVPWPTEEVTQVSVQPTQLYIQAGSFTDPSNAEGLRQRLSSYGPTFVETARVGTQTFYRVRVGPIGSVSEADSILNHMLAGGYPESHIVVD